MRVSALVEDGVVDSIVRRVGFRRLAAGGELERDGLSLTINDVPVFMRGAVWMPLDLEQPEVDPERLRAEVPVSRCADVVEPEDVDGLAALLTARLEHDEHHLARVAMRHHYFDDVAVGESTTRFLAVVDELVRLRDRLQGVAPAEDPSVGATAYAARKTSPRTV